MGYSYEDTNGWLSGGPSIGGAKALLDLSTQQLASIKLFPNLHEFITAGKCDYPHILQEEAIRLAKKVTDKDVKATLLKLAKAAAKAKGSIIMTH